MTSQIHTQANKRKAFHSSGPISPSGKLRASRNARKHGLSIGVNYDPRFSNRIDPLLIALAGEKPTPRQLHAARGVAEAQFELYRLMQSRAAVIEMEAESTFGISSKGMTSLTIEDIATIYLQCLPALEKFDRYERRALSRQRKVFQHFVISYEVRMCNPMI